MLALLQDAADLFASVQALVLPDKGVGQHLLDGDPPLRVFLQGHADEVSAAAGALVHDEVVSDYPVDLGPLGDPKGVVAGQQLVREGADGPGVDLLVVGLARNDLGREVEGRAADGGPDILGTVDRPPEVADLGRALSYPTST